MVLSLELLLHTQACDSQHIPAKGPCRPPPNGTHPPLVGEFFDDHVTFGAAAVAVAVKICRGSSTWALYMVPPHFQGCVALRAMSEPQAMASFSA